MKKRAFESKLFCSTILPQDPNFIPKVKAELLYRIYKMEQLPKTSFAYNESDLKKYKAYLDYMEKKYNFSDTWQ